MTISILLINQQGDTERTNRIFAVANLAKKKKNPEYLWYFNIGRQELICTNHIISNPLKTKLTISSAVRSED